MHEMIRTVLAWMLIAGMSGGVLAAPPPFPDFALKTLEGADVRSDDVVPEGRALVVFIQRNCRPCDDLLFAIKKEHLPDVPARMLIVVGGASPEEVVALKKNFPDLAEAAWYADPPWAAWGPLRLKGLPVITGLRDKSNEWRLSGATPEDKLRSVLSSWVAGATRSPQG
jgi:hypothetical protein